MPQGGIQWLGVYWTWLFSIKHNKNDGLTDKWLGSTLFGDQYDA